MFSLSPSTSSALFGALINFLLFGMLIVQVCLYAICFPQDSCAVKALVWTVFMMMLITICFNVADTHFWYAANFGDLTAFGQARFSPFYVPIMGSLVALLVQGFFAYRISIFHGARWVAAFITLISLAQAGGGMESGIAVYIGQSKRGGLKSTDNFGLRLVGSAVSDILIAASMTYLLLQTAEPSTQHIVGRIVSLVIETNGLTASMAVVSLIVFSGFPGMTYFIAPYANTLLLLLNNRATQSRTQTLSRRSNEPHDIPPNAMQLRELDTPNPSRAYPSLDRTISPPPRKDAGSAAI
ncbi:hypothetical protein C8J57DRAFT_1611375 [Mycena rebaudengoi]|nr:hypothetical protein C8J57DRAFT_1611375 [Mycena rebaudengoi]